MGVSSRDRRELCGAQVFAARDAQESKAAEWLGQNPPLPDLQTTQLHLALNPALRVEEAVLAHARLLGMGGFHGENAIWGNLFSLAFWEIIFAPIPGAFVHRFQRAPLDIASLQFYARRSHLFEERIAMLADGENLRREILRTLAEKAGLACRFASWHEGCVAEVESFVGVVSPALILGVLEKLARSPCALLKGFPDLTVLGGASGVEFWEVKGPGDTVRPEQEFWLEELRRLGAVAKVIKVVWKSET